MASGVPVARDEGEPKAVSIAALELHQAWRGYDYARRERLGEALALEVPNEPPGAACSSKRRDSLGLSVARERARRK